MSDETYGFEAYVTKYTTKENGGYNADRVAHVEIRDLEQFEAMALMRAAVTYYIGQWREADDPAEEPEVQS